MVFGSNPVPGRRLSTWTWPIVCAALLVSMGCTPGGTTNIITDVQFRGLSQRPNADCDSLDAQARARCTPAVLESLQFAKIGDGVTVVVKGIGRCSSVTVDFGDGGSATNQSPVYDANGELLFTHTYSYWPGKKQVRVRGGSCLGEMTKELSVGLGTDGHEEFRLGFVPNTSVCNDVSYVGGGIPYFRQGTVVRIEASGRIRYGVMEHDAGGDRTIAAPTGYPFAGHRPYSLVYRVVRPNYQDVQGENGPVIFTVTERGPLQICVNDHPDHLADNIGSIFLQISVNESQATGLGPP